MVLAALPAEQQHAVLVQESEDLLRGGQLRGEVDVQDLHALRTARPGAVTLWVGVLEIEYPLQAAPPVSLSVVGGRHQSAPQAAAGPAVSAMAGPARTPRRPGRKKTHKARVQRLRAEGLHRRRERALRRWLQVLLALAVAPAVSRH